MAMKSKSAFAGFDFSEQGIVTAVTILVSSVFGYVIYGAVMATTSELLQSLLVISPLLLVVAVHRPGIPIPGSEHRARGSAWGVAFVLVLLVAVICFQPSLNGIIF